MAHETRPLSRKAAELVFSNGTKLRGLAGSGLVRQRTRARNALRSAALPAEIDTDPHFDAALRSVGITEQETIELEAQAVDSDVVIVEPATTQTPDAPRVVLYQDESGGISWHYRTSSETGERRRRLRGSAKQSFVIPLRQQATATTLSQGMPRRALRGPITKIGRKIFKVFVLPALSGLLQSPVRWLGDKIESKARPYRVWAVTSENYATGPTDADEPDWAGLPAGPVLLFVHGIFSSVEGMLSRLPKAAMEAWLARYQRRVIAFNHPTASASPEDNARELLTTLQSKLPNSRLVIDIICHSRGGIVSRTLAERATALVGAHALTFRSVYFVATPNAGTPIGDADHMVDMIDLFTNCLTSFPDGPVTYSIEVLLGIVTLVGHAGATALPGIAALGTKRGYVVDVLNTATERPRAFYSAATANYQPVPGRDNAWLLRKLGSAATDRIFATQNDVVVPELGVFAKNGHPAFPIKHVQAYGANDGVWHTAFFGQQKTIDHINAHLDGVGEASLSVASATADPGRVGGGSAWGAPASREHESVYERYRRSRRDDHGAFGSGDGSVRVGSGSGGSWGDSVRGGGGGKGGIGSGGGWGGSVRGGGGSGDASAKDKKRRATSGHEAFRSDGSNRDSRRDRRTESESLSSTERLGGSATGDSSPAPTRSRLRGGQRKTPAKTPTIATPGTTLTEPEVALRDPWVDFHERLESGDRKPLTVRLMVPAATTVGSLEIAFDAGSDEVDLRVEVTAPGFVLAGESHATLRIIRPRQPHLEQATFMLEASDPGPTPRNREIDVSFWRGNDCVGGVRHVTVVVPKGYQAPTDIVPDVVSAVRVPSRAREQADLVFYVKRQSVGHDVFDLDMRSSIPGEEYERRQFDTFDLSGKSLLDYLSAAIDPSFDKFPSDDLSDREFAAALPRWNEKFLTALRDLGVQLWLLLPQRFRDEYLRLAGLETPPRSIFVYSDELGFPWELVRPSGDVRGKYVELPPLGIGHVLGRWKTATSAKPQPQTLVVSDMALLLPDTSRLGNAAAEAKELLALVARARQVRPLSRKDVDKLLASKGIQIVHFSGHGMLGANADLTALELEDEDSITAMAFAASTLGKSAQPILYLNACTVGRSAAVLGRPGGFAGNCIDSGWSGVVAPYWPVYDASAAEFAVAFYKKLKSGRSMGEALQELRSERPQDPTAQSYAYYGDPFARVLFEVAPTGGRASR